MSNNNNIPPEGSIQPGKVVRVEAYGCFVDLTNYYRLRGLVHISQLANNIKVEQVEDVVALEDQVWVKVLQVEQTQPPPQVRYKISLSLKDASQDGLATDLGAITERHQQLKQQITHSLTSSIGMGVALDPMAMAAKGRKSNSVLKQKGGAPATIINGYALVDDEDDYNEEPNTTTATNNASGNPENNNMNMNRTGPQVSAADPGTSVATKPMGRGRGTTLPAWMTRQQQEQGPTKAPQDKGKDNDDDSSNSKGGKHRRKHKHKSSKRHKHRSSRHHRSSKYDDDDEKFDNAKDDDSYSDDDRRKKRKRRHKDLKRSSRHRSKRRHHRSRSRSRSRSVSSRSRSRSKSPDRRHSSHTSTGKEHTFQSVEDAQKLIERLEAKKQKQRK